MTALLTVRYDQDWVGMAAAGCICLGILAVGTIEEHARRRLTAALNRAAVRVHAHGPGPLTVERTWEVDHEDCTNCGQTICYCITDLMLSAQCPHTINVGCLHLTHDGNLCADCRSQCGECRREDHDDQVTTFLLYGGDR